MAALPATDGDKPGLFYIYEGGKGNTRTAATETSKYLKTTPLVSLVSFFICSPSYLLPSF